jgi:hypothetical protein
VAVGTPGTPPTAVVELKHLDVHRQLGTAIAVRSTVPQNQSECLSKTPITVPIVQLDGSTARTTTFVSANG